MRKTEVEKGFRLVFFEGENANGMLEKGKKLGDLEGGNPTGSGKKRKSWWV